MNDPGTPYPQLPLALRLAPSATLDRFVPGANDAALANVEAVATGASRDALWLVGGRGTGKSHLLQAACAAADAVGRRAIYVPLARHAELAPDLLNDLDTLDLVALDDVDEVAGRDDWERALFGVLNASADRQLAGLLLGSCRLPAQSGFLLADLASRAAGAIRYRLAPLTEAGQIEALGRHAATRGLELDDAAARFLVHRVARDMHTLSAWLERLDAAALAAKKPITIPLIRAVLAQASETVRNASNVSDEASS